MKTAYEFNKELVQNIEPAMSYNGGNLDEWRISARMKLSELLGLDNFSKVSADVEIEYSKKIEGATDIRFTFQSEKGYRVPCHLVLPDEIENPPVMISLQGHSKGMYISMGELRYEGDENEIKGDRDFCIRAAKEGFASVALEQRCFGECGGDENGPRCYESSLTALLMGRTTIGERVWDVMRLIDVLETEFKDKIDVKKICCMGNSGGGITTAYLAALDDRIVLEMPSCAFCTYKDSVGAMWHCVCGYIPNISKYFDMNDLIAMAFPKYFIQVSGVEDKIFPIIPAEEVFEKGKAIYIANGKEENCVLVKGNGGHRFYADDAWPVVHRMMNR